MPTSPRDEPLLVQIPPSTSPLLLPAQGHSQHRSRSSVDSFTLQSNYRNPDIPSDLEFLAPGQWDDDDRDPGDEDDDGDETADSDQEGQYDDDDEDVEDWSLEDGHVEGVPSSTLRFDAKQYQQENFLAQLLDLCRDQLAIPGWSSLPADTPPSLVQIHKISGALTNSVFFVSVPETECEVEVNVTVESPGEYGAPSGALGDEAQTATPVMTDAPRLYPATVLGELERGRQAAATPKPREGDITPPSGPSTPLVVTSSLPGYLAADHTPPASSPTQGVFPPAEPQTRRERTTISAPTLLLRVYGPQSGSLISRRNELYILHTLSSQYGIGPHVLGTFGNGRVEEYFHSRALTKDEMRDPRVSRWIGRRMRELHSVELDQVVPPWSEQEEERERERRRVRRARSRSPTGAPGERPGPEPLAGGSKSPVSGASIYSTSSSSSVFSFGTTSSSSSVRSFSSSYSTSSLASVSTLNSLGMPRSLVSSPAMLPQRTASESRADDKKRARRRGASGRRSRVQDKPSVWEYITRWTREAKNVMKELDELAQLPGFERLLTTPSNASTPAGPSPAASPFAAPTGVAPSSENDGEHIPPLASASRTFALRSALNLPLFEQELRLYRAFVHRSERAAGRSKRVFAHNDTQYGNLLLMTPTEGGPAAEEELERAARREGGAHRRLIVVDFEYAGANPRAFDIANHFCEWQADYHHPSLSHSLSAHQPYPTAAERARFLRAYIGGDGGFDGPAGSEGPGNGRDDARVERLEEEVRLWQPSSHALWAVWGVVQAKEDLMARIRVWKDKAARGSRAASPEAGLVEQVKELGLEGDELVDLDEMEEVGEVFDYLSYALERMGMFRRELRELGVVAA
ncbi:hypothetical protein JCM10450v2_001242 [Rhodotorula kratochvilovae]